MKREQKETAEQYLERIPSFAKKKSGMEDVRAFLELLGSPDRGMKIFHVAGTNGKGSVCAFLSSALKEAGLCCGAFTSPHLSDIRERFLIQGEMVSREAFDQAFETVYGAAGQWTAQGKPHPTYFEFLFYMGMVLFSRAGTEVLVLETGMGGLYDVTNVVERPLVSVITSVSIDHTAFLGHTAGEIAVHKAGIIKPGCPAVYDDSCPEAEAVILEMAEKKGSPAFPVGCVPFRLEGETLVFQWDYLGKTEEFTVGFSAPYQAENAALAVTALSVSGLGIPAEAVRRGLRSARWPARMERLLPGVYLDGAHNEDGIRAFLEAAPAPVYLVTNSDDHFVEEALRRYGLPVAGAVTSQAARYAKPRPEIFRFALERYGLRPGETVHLGDSLAGDVETPRALGIRALWLNRKGKPVPPGVEAAENLAEAARTLAPLF